MYKEQQMEEIEALEAIYGADFTREGENSYSFSMSKNVKLFLNLTLLYPTEAPPTHQLMAPCLSKQVKNDIRHAFDNIYL